MTLHEDWHKAHPGYPCEYDTCPRGQVLDLENATYTAAEVKVLTETASKVAYALGRKDAGEEIALALEKAGDERSKHRHHERDAVSRLGSVRHASYLDAAKIAREIGSQDSPDATSGRTDPEEDA